MDARETSVEAVTNPLGRGLYISFFAWCKIFNQKRSMLITLFDDPGARVPPPPIVPSGTVLNPDGRDVPSPIEKLYSVFPPVTSGLYVAVPPEIHCGSSLELICRVLSVVVLVVQPLIIKNTATEQIFIKV